MASGLSKKVSEIETAVALLGYIEDRLRYLQPTVSGLIESACASGRFDAAAYLLACSEEMRCGKPFPHSWREAVERRGGTLGAEEKALMTSLGRVLGASDLESQLGAVRYILRRMERGLESARAYRDTHHKLYSSLGVLAGVALAIILV